MPNIEVHGCVEAIDGYDLRIVRDNIIEALTGRIGDAESDAVITTIEDVVADFTGKQMPFLRVLSSTPGEAEQIAKILSESGFDVEFITLEGFLEGEK